MTHPTPNNMYPVANGTASTAPFIEVFLPRNPSPNDVNYQVQQRWWNTVSNTEFVLVGFTTTGGTLQANWQQIATGMVTVETFTGDDNLVVDPVANNINLKGLPFGEPMGAILFTKSALTPGQMDAQVQTDGVTIGINGSNQLHTLITSASAIGVDTSTPPGTNPVLPTVGGQINFTGGQIAAGTTANVIRTDSTAANTVKVEVQRATTAGASTPSLNGVAHFNSAQFTVDGNGFVGLAGGPGAAIEKVNVQTGTSPIVPTGGAITINGATVAAGTNPVRTDGTGPNTMALEVQISQAIAATDATKIGLSAFDSGYFSVDGNGFTAVTGGTGIVGNTGTAFTSSAATQYNVQVGGATSSTLVNVPPSVTSGVPLISQGAAANPIFGTATVAGGGTGVTTLTGLALGSGTSPFTGVTYSAATPWTPVLSFGGASVGITYTSQAGEYTQIGNIVFFGFVIVLSSKGVSVGNALITGSALPVIGGFGSQSCLGYNQNLSYAGFNTVSVQANGGTQTFSLIFSVSGGPIFTATDASFTNATTIAGNGFYFTS